jgi:ATP-binding cassette subfamily F protein 3
LELLRFADLERSYGARQIFAGLEGVLRDGMRVGLVGPNGAGKSSLVRILAALDEPDRGAVVRARGTKRGYLSQDSSSGGDVTLRALLEAAFAHIHAEEARVRALEAELSAAADAHDAAREAKVLRDYSAAREAFDRHGGLGLERRMRSMLAAFGFTEDDLDRPAADFSGGQRTRAALARMLLEEPDYFILDEPTNHLDLDTVRWLETFLSDDPRAAIVVSHDRYFLDRVCNEIWELDAGRLERYETALGRAYSDYVEQKRLRSELALREYELFLAEEKRRKAVVAELRTHGSHNYSQVRSREKQLAKLAPVDAPETPQKRIAVRLDVSRRATRGLALAAHDLSKAYAQSLFSHLSFELARGERLAIVGPNGAGKSTLLDILAQRAVPDSGSVALMPGVSAAYLSQEAADELPAGQSAVDAVLSGSTVTPEEARALLGRLGLGGEAGDKPVEAFSGGERRRIMLARLMALKTDCLFLDEPTNDLDIASREALESVLAGYGGAMVVVSHDRYLLRRISDRLVCLEAGTATILESYDRFEALQRGAPAAAPAPPKPVATGPSPAQLQREERLRQERAARELAAAEREVARLDAEVARMQLEFADPAIYDDRARVATLEADLAAARASLDAAFSRWEELSNAS